MVKSKKKKNLCIRHICIYIHGWWVGRVVHVTPKDLGTCHLEINDHLVKEKITVSTYIDVFPWNLYTIILGLSSTCEPCEVQD